MTASAVRNKKEDEGSLLEAKQLRDAIVKERCEAVYFLNHNELTESPADTLRTQIMHLTDLEQDVSDLISNPIPEEGIFGMTMKFLTVSSIIVAALAVGIAVTNKVLAIILPGLIMIIAAVIHVGWDSMCCRITFHGQLESFQHHFKHIRRVMQQARRYGHLKSNREWEVNAALNTDPPAQSFWREAFGHDVTRVPVKRFETALLSVMKTAAVKRDAAKVAKELEEKKSGKKEKEDGSARGEDDAKDSSWVLYLERNKAGIEKLIRVCMGSSMHPVVTPPRFHSLLIKLGPFERILEGVSDLIEDDPEKVYRPWFFPVPLTRADLEALGEKMSDMELPWMSFMVTPSATESQFHDHAFRLVRYTKIATKFAEDTIYRSIFGFHVSMTGPELRKVFRHEARIADAIADVTAFPEKVLDVIIDLITVAPPVFERVGDLIAFYYSQKKLSE
eukprot:CAMPEP_0184491496 /NCGR_PEP_ID=MMETSP0113_2-20130426/20554_1 /TAXON_ID=91329 /ORGANISM="Norrisiella sphaerica, Strain BC52" /LENGTH=447 /DNA_ID=CAMNT_0026875889 /DNA_START=75 /DNA_END=1415 /DNA_ORIENTATION=+